MKHLLITCLILAGCISCGVKKGESAAIELHPLAYTVYTGKSELFVEFKPLVVGSTSKFATHLTKLGEYFLPFTEGAVTVSLIVNGKGIKNTVTAPGSPGIFHLALQPVQAGMGKLVFDITTKDFTDRIIIDSVMVYPDAKTARAAIPEEAPNPNEISYLKEQAWKIEFANMPVNLQPFNDVIRTTGQIQAAPGDEVTIAAKSDGIVRFSNKGNVQGAKVQAGQTLFTVSGGGVAGGSNIDAAVQTARAEFQKAKADYDRAKELVKDQLISQKEYQDIQLRHSNSQTQLNNLTGSYGSNGKTLTAPVSGFIKNVAVTEGQFVTAGQPIATISQNKQLMLRAEVSQKDFGKLRSIKSANFVTPDNRIFSTASLNGKLLSAGRNTSDNSMTVPVFFEINNTGDIVPGSVVEVYLQSDVIQTALVIPVSALIEEQGKMYVYVQTAGESFEKREVLLGAKDGILVEVLSGIHKDDRVVIKGAYQIKLATMSGTMPAHGHEH